MKKNSHKLLIGLIFVLITPFFAAGMALYWISKIILTAAHLCMFNGSTAWETISTDWINPSVNIKDIL